MITQTQIEAAAKVWYDFDVRNSRTGATWESAQLFYKQAATFALTAAAEVADKRPLLDRMKPYPVQDAEPLCEPLLGDGRTVGANPATGAAAEVGEQDKNWIAKRADIRNSAIERCAQVVDKEGLEWLAAKIRALK